MWLAYGRFESVVGFDVRCERHGLEWFGTFTIGDLRLFMVGLEFGRSCRVHAGYPVLP
jgi:hypothetical protein